jgi:phosphoribosyl-ATP pyrophosphohydrolase
MMDSNNAHFIFELEALIRDRKANPKVGSYTTELFASGRERIVQKVGEEAVEIVVAALAQSRERQVDEISDLFYHTLVLMTELDITLDEIEAHLAQRHKK